MRKYSLEDKLLSPYDVNCEDKYICDLCGSVMDEEYCVYCEVMEKEIDKC